MSTSTKSTTQLDQLFRAQQEALPRLRAEKASQRLKRLEKIRRYLLDPENEKRLHQALWEDLRKSPFEVNYTETGPLLMAMRHIKKRLHGWMWEKSVPQPLSMLGLQSRIQYEPKGNCLVISPWNYPLQLSLMAACYAIAAGNALVLKPSEHSPHTSAFLANMIGDLFPPAEFAVVTGEVETAKALLDLPFHHIFFTGSPQIGKSVMGAAARHLTSVTLELGGKSPFILDGTRSLKKTATQLAWSKCINAGQTCIAPDYVLLPEKALPEVVQHFRTATEKFYNPKGKGISASPQYGRIITDRHLQRLQALQQDALDKGANIEYGGDSDPQSRFFAPTLLSQVTEDMELMQEEIFGPILPMVTFKHLEEVPEILARRPKPLAFYIFSNSRKHQRFLLDHSSAGGTVINEVMVSSINPYLPFGGVNNSGIGKSNGHQGFVEFSNERGIVQRKWGTFSFLYPPVSSNLNRWILRLFDRF